MTKQDVLEKIDDLKTSVSGLLRCSKHDSELECFECSGVGSCEEHKIDLVCHECMVDAEQCVENGELTRAVLIAATAQYDRHGVSCRCDVCIAVVANLLPLRSMT